MHIGSHMKSPLIDQSYWNEKFALRKYFKCTHHLKIMYTLGILCCVINHPKLCGFRIKTAIFCHSKFCRQTGLNRVVSLLHMVSFAAVVVQRLESVGMQDSLPVQLRDSGGCQLGQGWSFNWRVLVLQHMASPYGLGFLQSDF